MSFNYTYVAGPNLDTDGVQILDVIDQFVFPISGGTLCLGDIHKKYEVRIEDTREKVYEIDREVLQRKLEHLLMLLDEISNEQDSDFIFIYKEIKLLRALLQFGAVHIQLLGNCNTVDHIIKLFNGTINNRTYLLASTYVHEMFHAYYNTKPTTFVEEIEEPIVEYSTIKFLEAFESAHPAYKGICASHIQNVKDKKDSNCISHYGFGECLYNDGYDWISLYKAARNLINVSSNNINSEVRIYKDYFKILYPYGHEDFCKALLFSILNGALGGTKPFPYTSLPNGKVHDEFRYYLRNLYLKSNGHYLSYSRVKSYGGPSYNGKPRRVSSHIGPIVSRYTSGKTNDYFVVRNGKILEQILDDVIVSRFNETGNNSYSNALKRWIEFLSSYGLLV